MSRTAQAKAAGTLLYVVGVGHKLNLTELALVASPPAAEHLFLADDFDALLAALHNATARLCGAYYCETDDVCRQGAPSPKGMTREECLATCKHP